MRLEARLAKLEDGMKTNDVVVFSVRTGEDPEVKQATAWQEYLSNGGRQEHSRTLFVQINEITR